MNVVPKTMISTTSSTTMSMTIVIYRWVTNAKEKIKKKVISTIGATNGRTLIVSQS